MADNDELLVAITGEESPNFTFDSMKVQGESAAADAISSPANQIEIEEFETRQIETEGADLEAIELAPVTQGGAWQNDQVRTFAETLQGLDAEQNAQIAQPIEPMQPWWVEITSKSMLPRTRSFPVGVNQLLGLALKHSAQISVYQKIPLIRETAIREAVAAFDWGTYVDSMWDDKSEPVGSVLTVGNNANRFRDHKLGVTAGLRRRLRNGASVDLAQQIGHQNNNSIFFVPNNQGTSRMSLGFTQPLLRGRGVVYNESLIVLAELDVSVSHSQYMAQLQTHLLEIVRGYWALHLERGTLAQRVKLYAKTKEIVEKLDARAQVDAQQSQLVSAQAALEDRRSDLIRARNAVRNAETRLRALVNAPELGTPQWVEILPTDLPSYDRFEPDFEFELQTALTQRPEVIKATREIKAGSIRLDMAKHEVLPLLNLVMQTYVSGLKADSDIGQAWLQQFDEGEPSYSLGLQFDMPLGRRAAVARRDRRGLELWQLEEQYRSVLELVGAEIDVAVREVRTSHREMQAKIRSLKAAELEVETLNARWDKLANEFGTGTLALEALLRAQERVTQAENEFLKSQMTYNLSLINLRKANGTLLQWHETSGQRILPNPPGEPVESHESHESIDTEAPVDYEEIQAESEPVVSKPRRRHHRRRASTYPNSRSRR